MNKAKELLEKKFLKSIEAADYLGITDYALRRHRSLGAGPAYVRVGDQKRGWPMYTIEDLDAWRDSLPRFKSLAEETAAGRDGGAS